MSGFSKHIVRFSITTRGEKLDILIGISLLVIGGLIGRFLPSYLGQKGKNLATKEDVEEITRKVEGVKSEYSERVQELVHQNNLLLEQTRNRQQLRLAALDKRLQAHQDAYYLWRKMISKVHSNSNADVVLECQDWYNKNCLFLSAEARAAFHSAYSALAIHPELLATREGSTSIKENFNAITDAGDVIVTAAELPPLGELESETIALDEQTNKLKKQSPESGSNSDGEYIRYQDGEQICEGCFTVKPTTGESTISVTFPASFYGKPFVVFSGDRSRCKSKKIGSSSFEVVFDMADEKDELLIEYQAKGHWTNLTEL